MQRDKRLLTICLLCGFAAVSLGAYIWFYMPHDRQVGSVALLLFKLLPYILAAISIAYIPTSGLRYYAADTAILVLAFSFFYCVFVPRLFFHADEFEKLYYVVLVTTPYVMLCLVLSYRLGGGSSEDTLRIAAALLLVMLSGAEDLAFLVVNPHEGGPWSPIPEVWWWASHITVFFGRPAHKYEAYAFIALHLALAIVVLRFRRRRSAPTSP